MCKIEKIILAALLLVFCLNCQALIVGYEVIADGEDLWEYKYTITNDEAFDIESISITFDSNVCYNLNNTSSPDISGGWDEQFLNYIPGSVIYDVYALEGNKIGVGESVSGFSVSFNYSGSGLPGIQFFEVYDPDDFGEPIVTGWTIPIPEPATVLFAALGFAIFRKTKN